VIQTWNSKSAKDISLLTIITFTSGIFMWLVYGIIIDAKPVILANSVTLLLQMMILYLKLRY
jgi:Uncharacterized conserved protein